jgi:hypothetical protein
MERRGSITEGMRLAGENFRECFMTAQLDPLSASEWSIVGARDELSLRINDARSVVWRALLAVGGINSPAGSCLWHVVGWKQSLKKWALEQGWNGHLISQKVALGILIASLGMLEEHFGIGKDYNNCVS